MQSVHWTALQASIHSLLNLTLYSACDAESNLRGIVGAAKPFAQANGGESRNPAKPVAQRHASRISQGMNGRAEKSTVQIFKNSLQNPYIANS
ncbi:MAG: hypothetical protein II030_08185, partial [Treponema sp.]|nr:hypothetical protein [Treponema sp.]